MDSINESNININNNTLNHTRSVDIQTSQKDTLSENRDGDEYFIGDEDISNAQDHQQQYSPHDPSSSAVSTARRIQLQSNIEQHAQLSLQNPNDQKKSKDSSDKPLSSLRQSHDKEHHGQQPQQKLLNQQELSQQQSNQQNKKIWAVSGKMPGQVSKKFVRDYKVGRYKKIQSLKNDMEYLNSPHHEQKHLGNTIFPFQNNTKSRIHLQGSFDYRKYSSTQETTAKKSPDRIYSPSTTSRQVMGGTTHLNHSNYSQEKMNSHQQSQASQQQMEIRYIDIISQPLIKPIRFVDNMTCAHSMTNLRHTTKKNFFFQPEASHYDWKKKQEQQDAITAKLQSRYADHLNIGTMALMPSLQPKNLCFEPEGFTESNFGKASAHRAKSNNNNKLEQNFFRNSSHAKLPAFAAVPENITFFSKAKANLVKYVNDIGTKENPLLNTFVPQRKFF